MGFLDLIGKGFSQIGKAINEKIAKLEKATGIDIPFVGATKQEISSTKQPQATPTKEEKPQPTPQEQKTYIVELGTQVHPKQIEELESD